MKSYVREKVVKLELAGGWQGIAVEKWAKLAVEPDSIAENPEKVFKSDSNCITAMKKFKCGVKKPSLVFKKTTNKFTGGVLFDFIRGTKARRNFNLALELSARGIDTALPAAALWRRKAFGKTESILLTEYIPGSINLYDVAFGRNREIIEKFSSRKEIITQVASILAKLRKAGYWHRDSKAGNFIVYKNGDENWRARLVDLDGIKPNYLYLGKNNVRTLAKLAETLTRFRMVNFTDLYRGFFNYCRELNIYHGERRRWFGRVERMTVAMRLATAVADSYKEVRSEK
ncbi:MAG: lipopolysaccharide kinase InaA family protein [Phycisphaerae bacterium]|jgi:hypothetical protein